MPRNTTVRDKHRRHIAKTKAPCHICHEPIDYTLPHLDPWAFTIDHITPLNKGGDERDPANIAAAHRRCNRTKSDRLDGEDPRRRYTTTLTW
jgi:5-methylcytosine-specific restriction endonuclease McrA